MINQRESHHWHSPSYRISVRTRWQDKWSNTIQCWSGMVLTKVTDLQQPNSPTKLVWEDLTNLQKPETGRVMPLWKWCEMNLVTGKCEPAKWQQLIRLTENLIFQRQFLYLVMRVWKWRILARQWRRNDGHQRTDLPGDYPLSHGPTFSFVPSPLAGWSNFITSEITVSSTITIIHT